MRTYWIQVYNQLPLADLAEQSLMVALLATNFQSLCNEYGLDQAMIEPALSDLELIAAPENVAPFFLLKYRPHGGVPLVVYRWQADGEAGEHWLREARKQARHPWIKEHLAVTHDILAVSLRTQQLKDFGLLLAYEVARWAGAEGEGLVYGLDGIWYRLNRHQAFIPIESNG